MEDAKQVFKYRPDWFVSFVHREANEATHILAKFKFNLNEETVWMEDYPIVISDIVVVDSSN